MTNLDSITATLNIPDRLVVLPTSMGYVLAAKAADQVATERLYALDDSANNPAVIMGESIDQLADLGIIRRYIKAYDQYWPGAVAVVIPSSDPKLAYLRSGQGSLIVCVPDDSGLITLLETCGPLITKTYAFDIATAKALFGKAVDKYFDGGNLEGCAPATIIRVVDDAVEIIRAGAVDIRDE